MHMHISLFNFKATTTNLGFVDKQCSIMIFEINTKCESKSGITAKNQRSPYGKRGFLQTFTHVLRTENPTFSVRFRIGESQYSFHYKVVFLRGKCR